MQEEEVRQRVLGPDDQWIQMNDRTSTSATNFTRYAIDELVKSLYRCAVWSVFSIYPIKSQSRTVPLVGALYRPLSCDGLAIDNKKKKN